MSWLNITSTLIKFTAQSAAIKLSFRADHMTAKELNMNRTSLHLLREKHSLAQAYGRKNASSRATQISEGVSRGQKTGFKSYN